MGIERQVARLLAVALEESRQGLAAVQHAEEVRVVDQFLVPVRVGRGGGDESIWDPGEQRHELLEGIRAVGAQHSRLVETCGAESRRVDLA